MIIDIKYGGSSTDYLMVEEENKQGMTRICLIVGPELGIIEEESLVPTILAKLAEDTNAEKMMAQV